MEINLSAVISAGGKGTRLSELTKNEIPKPMVPVCGKPILEHQIDTLKKQGIVNYYFLVGHLKEKIIEYFGDGRAFGVNIKYITENEPLGSAGSLYYLKDIIKSDFLFVYGDTIFDIDVKRMYQYHVNNNSAITPFVHPNTHPYDSDLLVVDDNNKIVGFDSKHNDRQYYSNLVNAAFYVVNNSVLQLFDYPHKMDFAKDVILPNFDKIRMVAYKSSEYIKDVGTPIRIAQAEHDIQSKKLQNRNLSRKQKCIFVDRDGTLNVFKGLIFKPDQIELESGVTEAIKKINASDYLVIMISNQPVVARGMCTIEDVKKINSVIETNLGNEGAFLDDIRFCPHHPDKGYPEENPIYKIVCNCRKPKIGMILESCKKYNIDLSKSYFVGDTTVDIQTGLNAGLKTVLLQTGLAGNDGKFDVKPDFVFKDLNQAMNFILEEEIDEKV